MEVASLKNSPAHQVAGIDEQVVILKAAVDQPLLAR
jgi:hypothetical protein